MTTLYGGRRAGAGKAARVVVQESRFGRELLVDGTFASFYRPGEVATGSVWDAIALPVLALPPARRRRILVLGLGAGSSARVVRALAPEATVVGVEFNAEIVRVAKTWFDLDALDIEVEIADARAYLARSRRRFDLILEDVFVGSGDRVHKPAWLPSPGHRLAARRLSKGGILVSNALDEANFVAWSLRDLFPAVVEIGIRDFDNRVFVGGGHGLSARSLRQAATREPCLRETLCALSLRTIKRARC